MKHEIREFSRQNIIDRIDSLQCQGKLNTPEEIYENFLQILTDKRFQVIDLMKYNV